MDKSTLQPRLDSDVAASVAASAKANSRSAAGEVNHALRRYYSGAIGHIVAGPKTSIKGSLFVPACCDPETKPNSAWKEAPLEISFGAVGKKSYRKMAAFAKKMTKRYNGK